MGRRQRLTGLIAVVALVLFASLSLAGPASAASPSDEQGFVNKINQERMSRNLRPLIFDMKIRDVARAWTDKMASTGNFVHNPDYSKQIPAGWSGAAENIAWGSGTNATVDVLHQGFMNSTGHRDNILGDYTRVGVGVTVTGGKMWVTEDFGKYAGDPVPNADGSIGGSGAGTTTTTTAPPASGPYLLTVAKKGKGSVSSSPAGITCGSVCSKSYAGGTSVTLTATPRSARTPVWSGACTGSATTCTVTMTAARSVKVTFT
ncbi:MAG: hypothetical protein QOE35_3289 [Actinomycetota bacterium]|jgi:hypothetical protein